MRLWTSSCHSDLLLFLKLSLMLCAGLALSNCLETLILEEEFGYIFSGSIVAFLFNEIFKKFAILTPWQWLVLYFNLSGLWVSRLNSVSVCVLGSLFLHEICMGISELSKIDCPPNMIVYHPIHWRPEKDKRQRKVEFGPFSPASLLSWEMSFSSVLGLAFISLAPLVSRPSDSDWISRVYSLQRTDVELLCLHYLMRQFLIINLHLYLYIFASPRSVSTHPIGSDPVENPD